MQQTYPSGRVVRNEFDADGALSRVLGNALNQTEKIYANSFSYTTAGAVESVKLGNGKWESAKYNERLQVEEMGLGNSAADTSLLKLEFDYGTSTQNNGSMLEQKMTVPSVGTNQGFTATQTYTYDSLNRLESATENVPSSQTWKQTFQYDRYGNRRYNTDNSNTTTMGSCSQAVCNPLINTSDNRLSAGQGYGYDKDGNVILDVENQRFVYDAESKQTQFFKGTNNTSTPDATYLYDGEGKRVKKISYQETTVFVYDGAGQLVAEYSTQISATPQTSYLTQDHLGSPRVTTNQFGAVTSRRDFRAFGEEALTAQRTSGLGYNSDVNNLRKQPEENRQDYTGYQKDEESGLEYAQARYYNSSHGRFTSVDPLTASASIKDPQTFNRYGYVLNSPYKFTDPLGLLPIGSGACGQWCSNSGPSVDGSSFRGRDTSLNGLINADVVPTFDWDQLSPDEQRLFNSMCQNGLCQDPGEGRRMFEARAHGTPQQQRDLAGILNQTSQLENLILTDGEGNTVSAISLVNSIYISQQDRIIANVSPKLKELIKNAPNFTKVLGHDGHPDSYKNTKFTKGGLQLSFTEGGYGADVDTDIYNIEVNGSFKQKVNGVVGHTLEVVGNKLTGRQTNPYVIWKILDERGFTPNYKIK